MTAGISGLPIRSSPTRRSILHKAHQLAHAPADTMLAKANKAYQASQPQPKNDLSKQLFPSSSPTPAMNSKSDIRDQFKRAGSTAASARTEPSQSNQSSQPYNSISSSTAAYKGTARGSLASLYGNSNSFSAQPSSVIDLTGPDAQAKLKEAVWFAEDDFSDDENLDLDYEAPSALPASSVPRPTIVQAPKDKNPPPATQSIPWSSSPPSHFVPPKVERTISEQTSTTVSEGTLKRDSSGERDVTEAPAPKKAKRRVLPASFQQKLDEDEDLPPVKTPSSKSRHFFEPTASAIKEQKRQLKNQRQPQDDEQAQYAGALQEAEQEAHLGKVETFSLSAEQKHILELVVEKNQSVFFTGPAGTGKSVLMRAIIAEMKRKYARDPERVAVTASTGLAACNIGGMTLHSFAGIGLGKEDATQLVKKVRRNQKVKNRWLRTKCLIIDEVSMCDGSLFDKLSQIGRIIRNNGRPWGGIQLIITGDFFQLPPVPDYDKEKSRDIKFAFEAATWNTSIDHTIGLTQVFRQRDPAFAKMLNDLRLGVITPESERAFKALARPLSFNDGVETAQLYPTRAQVESSNSSRLNALPGKMMRFDAMDVGGPNTDASTRDKLLSNMMAPKSIDLKINAQVMLIKNLDDSLVNGSLGKVIAFSDEKTFEMSSVESFDSEMDAAMNKARQKLKGFSRDSDTSESSGMKYPVVQFMGVDGTSRTILCQPEEWKVEQPNGEIIAKRTQLPLILAWALSIHKAQGQTLERVAVNLTKIFEKGQAYVALSRATTQAGLQVIGFNKHKVMAHPRVVTFYNSLYSAEEATSKPSSVGDFITNRTGRSVAAPVAAAKKPTKAITLDDDEEALASYNHF